MVDGCKIDSYGVRVIADYVHKPSLENVRAVSVNAALGMQGRRRAMPKGSLIVGDADAERMDVDFRIHIHSGPR